MCYLFGISYNKNVDETKLINEFLSLPPHSGKSNNGYGVAFIDKYKKPKIIKKTLPYSQNIDFKSVKTFIGHYREASVGSIHISNNHPFAKKINNKNIVFAHNGNVQTFTDQCKINTNIKFQAQGSTDSEISLCYFLNHLNSTIEDDNEFFAKLYEHCIEMVKHGTYNIMLSYQEKLFIFNSSNNQLRIKYIKNDFGYIFSTEHVGCFNWRYMGINEAIIVENGTLISI